MESSLRTSPAAGSHARIRVPFENMRTQCSYASFLSVSASGLSGGYL